MSKPTIIGKPAILVADDNPEWIENLEFSLGDQYRIVVATDLAAAANLAQEHGPEVMLLDWQIAQREVERARAGITMDGGRPLPVILMTGFERPVVDNVAHLIGGCIAVVERLDTLEELEREIARVISCAQRNVAREPRKKYASQR